MNVKVYNQEGKKTGEISLPKEIFGVALNSDLVHQVAVSQMANRRKPIAHTKDRGEVSGGGRKPWRQKGTGRARHGSIRSPIWIGGGVAFGPNPRKYIHKVPKKVRKVALCMALTDKVQTDRLKVIDSFDLPDKFLTLVYIYRPCF